MMMMMMMMMMMIVMSDDIDIFVVVEGSVVSLVRAVNDVRR